MEGSGRGLFRCGSTVPAGSWTDWRMLQGSYNKLVPLQDSNTRPSNKNLERQPLHRTVKAIYIPYVLILR